MLLSRKIELKPNNRQVTLFRKHVGTARFAWNWGLAICIEANNQRKAEKEETGRSTTKWPSAIDLHKRLVAEVKPLNPWFYDVSKCSPQQALRDLESAFRRMHTVPGAKFPKFKKRGGKSAFYTESPDRPIATSARHVRLPRVGWVRCKQSIPCGVQFNSVVISERAGRWFMSFTVEVPVETNTNTTVVGVDLGIKAFATLSTGETHTIPQQLGLQQKLKRAQHAVSRRKKGSGRRNRARMKLARIHYRIANVRKDATHKLTHHLAKNHGAIVIEDLNVSGMLRNHHLAASIAAANFGEVRRQLEYKTQRFGSALHVVDRWYPSSKTCHACGHIKSDLKLSQRVYECESCGISLDRDLNAAMNLAASHAVTARWNPEVTGSSSRCRNRHVKKPELLITSGS